MAAVTVGTAAGSTVGAADASLAERGSHAGPPYTFTTELIGDGTAIPMKNQAMLTRTKHGYLFRTGQQNSHLMVTRVDRGLRLHDSGTQAWKKRSPACERLKVRRGIGAVCRVPRSVSVRRPLLLEVWPRLGHDYLDATTLPATFALTMLGDKGHDVARFGAGPDFFNGFAPRDVVSGGAGSDWLRPGVGDDDVNGGSGNDEIVALEGKDTIRGGSGKDELWGGDGNDRLRAGAGADYLLCGNGRDRARVGAGDRATPSCEAVN